MVNWCYLCDRKASKADNISLHRFPRNLNTRAKWLNACGLTADDDVKGTVICSRHFVPKDICQSKIFGDVKAFVKRHAVPKLFLTNPSSIEESNKSLSKTLLMELVDENPVANESSSFFSYSYIGDHNYSLDNDKKSPEKYLELNSIDDQISNNSSEGTGEFDEDDVSHQYLKNRMTDSSSEGENTASDGHYSSSQCKKRRFFEPRHVSEISSSDFATPERANRTIQLIRKTNEDKSKKMKQLQRQVRDLQKRVKSLQDLAKQLKKNRKLANKGGDASMI